MAEKNTKILVNPDKGLAYKKGGRLGFLLRQYSMTPIKEIKLEKAH